MPRLNITRDHLFMAQETTRERVTDGLAVAGGIAVSAGLLGAAVGYRHAAGMSEDETMPHLGPVPADAIVMGVGLLAGMAIPGKAGKFVFGLGGGGEGVFVGTVGQSFGAMLHDKMASSSGGGQAAPQLQQAAGWRDAFGKWHPGKQPVAKNAKGGAGQAASAVVPKG